MIRIGKVLANEELLREMLGIGSATFSVLLSEFSVAYAENRLFRKKGRLRTDKQRLFFVLFYVRHYPTLAIASLLFRFSPNACYQCAQKLMPVLELTLGRKLVLPDNKLRKIQQFKARFPKFISWGLGGSP